MRRKSDRSPLITFNPDGSFEPSEVSWDEIDKWVLPDVAKRINKMIYRLAEYEKTGMAPDDVRTLYELFMAGRKTCKRAAI